MTRVYQLAGAAGSAALDAMYAAYYASIAQTEASSDATRRRR
ncbi:hypothetical protein [Streptomyces zagrosensis]|uniref:Uncharacterized protein n=1 Tax=Streptomyces zagrosensis TaxID=1042984 RepID=A0A7W9V126_9ACTN|nr:hypothetical protein [Streptomyces zagrosensis]MBB5937349.1 hypothetical protein [Streptomyces zagrosensis]